MTPINNQTDSMLKEKANKLIDGRNKYVESFIRFFRDRPDSRVVVVSVDEPNWIEFITSTLGFDVPLPADDLRWQQAPQHAGTIDTVLDHVLAASTMEEEERGGRGGGLLLPASCLPLSSHMDHNLPLPLKEDAPLNNLLLESVVLVDSRKDFRGEQGYKGLYYEFAHVPPPPAINQSLNQSIPPQPEEVEVKWIRGVTHADDSGAGYRYLDIKGKKYPYISREHIFPHKGKKLINLAARAWNSTLEGMVLVQASFHLADPHSAGDGVNIHVEVDGVKQAESHHHALLPSNPEYELAATVRVRKGSIVRVVTHPRDNPHHDTIEMSFTIFGISQEDTSTTTLQ